MNLGEGYKGAPGTSRTILYQPLKVTKKDSIKKKWKRKTQMGRKYLQYVCLEIEMYPEYTNNFYNSIVKRKLF